MTRQIKFRAWEIDWKNDGKIQGRMIQWPDIRDEFALIQDKTSQFVLMQWTGLVDPKGKEIYEGDLLRSKGKVVLIHWSSNAYGDSIGFGAIGLDGDTEYNIHHFCAHGVVAGNIYDREDLLQP